MHQIKSTRVLRHARAGVLHPSPCPANSDLRWSLLDLVRNCRTALGLRDRDVAVLRGLLSLLPDTATQRTIFASNKVLIERCDGIDERTLRRRLAHLQARGLVARRLSPNGKRFQVRDADNAPHLTYGIDLQPLFNLQTDLQALAEACARERQQVAVLRARIRDTLYHAGAAIPEALADECRRALRRVTTSAYLQALLDKALNITGQDTQPEPAAQQTTELSASNGQNDRHIQNSDKEPVNKKPAKKTEAARTEVSLDECLDKAPTARAMAIEIPRTWQDLARLCDVLGPAIGLKPAVMQESRQHLGLNGHAIAIIGLVEAFDRIRNPEAYLRTLIRQAKDSSLNMYRMFRSLVGKGRNHLRNTCIPG